MYFYMPTCPEEVATSDVDSAIYCYIPKECNIPEGDPGLNIINNDFLDRTNSKKIKTKESK